MHFFCVHPVRREKTEFWGEVKYFTCMNPTYLEFQDRHQWVRIHDEFSVVKVALVVVVDRQASHQEVVESDDR